MNALAEVSYANEADGCSLIAAPDDGHLGVSAFASVWSKHFVFGGKPMFGIVDAHTNLVSIQRTKNGGWW